MSFSIERADVELRAVLVDGHEPSTGFTGNLDLQPRDSTLRIVFEIHQQSFDQRVPRREEAHQALARLSARSQAAARLGSHSSRAS